jgi:hypothetical protein
MDSTFEQKSRIFNLSCFAYQVLIALWSLMQICKVGQLLLSHAFFFTYQDHVLRFVDFLSFYKCGKIVCSTTPWLLYDQATQQICFNQLIAPLSTTVAACSSYPPPFYLLMALLSFSPIFWAYLIWMVGSVAFGFYGMWCLLDTVAFLKTKERVLFLLAVFSSLPSCNTIFLGQPGWLMLGAGALFVSCFFKKRDILAGLSLSIVAVKPQYFLFLILPALAGKRYKIIGSAIFFCAFQYLLAGSILGWQAILQYPKAILFDEEQIVQKHVMVGPEMMVCLRAFLNLFTAPAVNFTLSSIIMAAALLLLFFLWRRVNNCPLQSLYSCFSLTIILAVFLNPHVFLHDSLLLAIPAALSLKTLSPVAMAKSFRLSERLLFYSFLLCPAISIVSFIVRNFYFSDYPSYPEFFLLYCLILGATVVNFKTLYRNYHQ